jgi:hypothetical protein
MFSHPLPKPINNRYYELGVGPEATLAEIRQAKNEMVAKLKVQITDIQKKMPEASRDDESRIQPSQSANHLEKDRVTQDSRHGSEKLASAKLDELKRKKEQLEQEILDINSFIATVESQKKRAEYDRRHPPCALLKIESTSETEFSDLKRILFFIRCEVANYFAERNIPVVHPSDLTREDFQADFSYNKLLDGEDEL